MSEGLGEVGGRRQARVPGAVKVATVAAATVLVSMLLASSACGGDDGVTKATGSQVTASTGGDGPAISSSGTGTDGEYLKTVCSAFRGLMDANRKESQAAKTYDELAKKMTPAFETFGNQFAAANAPADLQQWQVEAAGKVNQAVARLSKEKSGKAMDALSEVPYSEFPSPAKARLAALAPGVAQCANLSFAGISGNGP